MQKKLDITADRLYVCQLSLVMRSTMNFRGRPNFVSARHSDALIYVTTGECDYTFDDGVKFTAREGNIIYLPHRSVYRMDSTMEYSVIYFDFLFLSDEPRLEALFYPHEAMGAEALFRKLYRTYRSSDAEYFSECMSTVYKILGIVTELGNKAYVQRSSKERILGVKEYIDRSYGDPELSVSRLADMLGMSEVYFRRLFRAVVGTSPIKYITKVRLDNARALIAHEYLSLEECALACGFSTVQYFSRVFKQELGEAPARYRKSI